MTVIALDSWVTVYFTGQIGCWDQRAMPQSSIYFWGSTDYRPAYYEWELGGCGSEKVLPDGAIRMSCGGIRMRFKTLNEAKDYAESYVRKAQRGVAD